MSSTAGRPPGSVFGGGPSVWAPFDARRDQKPPATAGRRLRWVVDAVLPLALTTMAAIGVLLPTTLATDGRLALFAFALAIILWSTTPLNAAYVALGCVALLVITGGAPQEQLFDALASDVIWLMIGAFILGAAVQRTGLAARLTQLVVGRARTVGGVFWLLTTMLLPLSVLIPSTSGRAAVAIPVFRSIARTVDDPRISRGMALLMPTVILVTTASTLVGAGSHLIANDLLGQIAGERLSFAAWALYGVPFGVTAGFLSCWMVCRLFLTPEQRRRELPAMKREERPFATGERITLSVAVAMVGLWLTEGRHGLEIATVTVLGALVLTMPGLGVLSWKDGLKDVSWNLIVFVGAALVLGRALIETGAAEWIIGRVFSASGLEDAESRTLVLVALAAITLTSHLYMTSHTARAAAMVPPLLYLAASLELNPVAVMFIGTIGMDYCLTFPVSSKALLMFQELDEETFQPADLLKLSAVLLPIHFGLIVIFYYGLWRWIGLAL